jgi:hypothetical protein
MTLAIYDVRVPVADELVPVVLANARELACLTPPELAGTVVGGVSVEELTFTDLRGRRVVGSDFCAVQSARLDDPPERDEARGVTFVLFRLRVLGRGEVMAELAPGDALVWVCQDGQIRPLGNGPEVPHSWQRGPVTSRLLAQLREGERQ